MAYSGVIADPAGEQQIGRSIDEREVVARPAHEQVGAGQCAVVDLAGAAPAVGHAEHGHGVGRAMVRVAAERIVPDQ